MPQPRTGKGGDYSKRKGKRRVLRLKALLKKRREQVEWVWVLKVSQGAT